MGAEAAAAECRPGPAAPLCARPAPAGTGRPGPGRHTVIIADARIRLARGVPIDIRAVRADFFKSAAGPNATGPAATRPEVHEQRPVLRGEQVARSAVAVRREGAGLPVRSVECGAGTSARAGPACSRSGRGRLVGPLGRHGRHPGQDVTGQQTRSGLVRAMGNEHVVVCGAEG
ncbi:hypothetical protein GCM10023238_25070 [Streptomyces heliomycini]